MIVERAEIVPGVVVTFAFDPDMVAFSTSWAPMQPPRMSGDALRTYKAARTRFMQKVAAAIGGAVAVAESPESVQIIKPPKEGRA